MKQFCTFRVDGALYGIPVEQVQEVLRYQHITPTPLSPDAVRGLINLRGKIVPAIDLRIRLGLEPALATDQSLNVVVRTTDGNVSLLVDEIAGVIDVDETANSEIPDTLSGPARQLICSTYKLANELLLEIEVNLTADVFGQDQQEELVQ